MEQQHARRARVHGWVPSKVTAEVVRGQRSDLGLADSASDAVQGYVAQWKVDDLTRGHFLTPPTPGQSSYVSWMTPS
jgi:hypothetical protein